MFDSLPKSPQDLYSAGKVSPGGSFDAALIDSVMKDNKSEFVSLVKRLDSESERSQALKLLSACCGYDALNCASSIIDGDLGSIPYINDVAADTGLSPLHTAAEANSPRCVEMLLKQRARTDMRTKDERALLPLELSLCNGSLEVPWNPSGDSIADLIRLLVDKDLTVVKLLAEKTKDVDVVAHAFARAGAILPFTALLIVAIDKIREATVALQDDDSVSKNRKLTIYESLIQEAIQMQSVCSQKRMLLLREIELLRLFGAAVFSEVVNKQTSPLISIVQAGDEALLVLLRNTNIDVNETDAQGNTLLQCSLKGSSVPHKQKTRLTEMMRVVDNVEGDDEEESIMRTTNGDTHLAGEYSRQASLPKRTFFRDDDDPDQTDEDNDGWYKDAWYEKAGVKEDDVEESTSYVDKMDVEDLHDANGNADPDGIMMRSPDLKVRLQKLGVDVLQQLGDNVLSTLLISTQRITEDTATKLLGERFNAMVMLINRQTELMLRSACDVGHIFWEMDDKRYRNLKSRKIVGRRLAKAAGYVRDQEGCKTCWSFASTDLISASLVLHGWEKEYRSLSPNYLCQKVNPSAYKHHKDRNGVVHYCYASNMESALMHVKKYGIPKEEWDGQSCNTTRAFDDENEDRYFITRVFHYHTLTEALNRLKTHPVGASLAMFSGWEERNKVYRGPLKKNSVYEGDHNVVMLDCREMNGEMVVKCKLSNGTTIGFSGYLYVSLKVMLMLVGARRRQGRSQHPLCSIGPQHLLSDFYSIDMTSCENAPFKERPELAERNLQFEVEEEEESEEEKKVRKKKVRRKRKWLKFITRVKRKVWIMRTRRKVSPLAPLGKATKSAKPLKFRGFKRTKSSG